MNNQVRINGVLYEAVNGITGTIDNWDVHTDDTGIHLDRFVDSINPAFNDLSLVLDFVPDNDFCHVTLSCTLDSYNKYVLGDTTIDNVDSLSATVEKVVSDLRRPISTFLQEVSHFDTEDILDIVLFDIEPARLTRSINRAVKKLSTNFKNVVTDAVK